MTAYKSNHFVTKAYLKRWTHPIPWNERNQKIWMKSIKSSTIMEVPYEQQCQKDFLYKIPDDFPFEDKMTIEKHWFGFTDEIYPKAMNNSLDEGKIPENRSDLGSILQFVIWQSFRTPKYRKATEDKMEQLREINPSFPKDNIDFNLQIPYLIVKAFVPFMNKVIPEFIISPNDKWFITSDNPSSLWLNTWNKKVYQPTLLGLDFNTVNLEILCPLNPQVCILLHLNQTKTNKNYLGVKRNCTKEEVEQINNSIFEAAEKTIYSFDRKTLEETGYCG
jgi:hypothetical protein